MKKIEIQSSKGHKTIKLVDERGVLTGGEKPFLEVFKLNLIACVNFAPYTPESSRIWANIGNKLDALKGTTLELEDDEHKMLVSMVKVGVPKAFPTMKDRYWADEIMGILENIDSEDKNNKDDRKRRK